MSGVLAGLIGSIKSGISWTTGTLPASRFWKAATYAPLSNGSFFVFGGTTNTTASNSYYYSTDGDSWTLGSLPSLEVIRWAVASSSRIFVTFTGDKGFYSDNGTTWTEVDPVWTTDVSPTDGLWDGSRFIFVSLNTTAGYAYSSDGITWATRDIGNGAASIDFDGTSTYVAVLTGTTGRINTTDITSAAAWSNITLPSSLTWTSVRRNNSIWLAAAAGSSTYATSTNGTTWTSRTLPAVFSTSGANIRPRMQVRNGIFYYVSFSGGVGTIYSSSDGINWTSSGTTSTDLTTIVAWAVSSNKMLGFGSIGATTASDDYIKGDG